MVKEQEQQLPVRACVKLTLCGREKFFGPGVCELLEGIRETGRRGNGYRFNQPGQRGKERRKFDTDRSGGEGSKGIQKHGREAFSNCRGTAEGE